MSLAGQLEADLIASASDIRRAIADAQARTAAEAAEQAAADVRREAEQQISALRDEYERQLQAREASTSEEIAALRLSVGEERARLAEANSRLEDLQRQVDAVQSDRDESQRRLQHVEQQLEESLRAAEEQKQSAEAASAEAAVLRHELEGARREAEDQARRSQDVRRMLEEAQSSLAQAQVVAAQERAQLEDARREVELLRSAVSESGRLDAGLRALESATSLVDVLDGLARLACHETERVALFLVNGGRIRGWRAFGFESSEGILGSDLDAEHAGVIGEAVTSGTGRECVNGDGSLPAFAAGSGARRALAVPVEVAGSVIAVLYADAAGADRSEEARWPEMVETMTRHAGRVLEAMTVRHAAALSSSGASVAHASVRNRPAAAGGAA